jgi:hypothetical protein
MRILKGVVGSLVITASPSEPILAIAAAVALNESEQAYEKALNTLLKELVLKCVVLDRGLMGEFGSRLMLLLTRNKATTKGGKKFVQYNQATDSHTVPAVQLSTFLQTLLGKDFGISDAKHSNTALMFTAIVNTATLLFEASKVKLINYSSGLLAVLMPSLYPLRMQWRRLWKGFILI